MLTYPYIDPVVISIGPLDVHWYGMMYLIGFVGGWWLGVIRTKQPHSNWKSGDMGDLMFYIAVGVVFGGRIGYMLFYNPFLPEGQAAAFYEIWKGGMSFHGGFLGVLIAMWLYGRKTQRTFFEITDFIAPLVTIGLGAGRIGNYINGELWGKVTDLPWGMQLPCIRYPQFCDSETQIFTEPRHPSQLYEFALEGVLLLAVLWIFSRKPRPIMATSGLFMICYGAFRFLVEFVRLPDAELGYLAFNWVTMGQLLSFPMIIIGVWMMWYAYKRNRYPAHPGD